MHLSLEGLIVSLYTISPPQVLPSIGGSITPLKTPPPITPQMLSLMNLPSTVISPLAPDTPVQKPNFSLPLSVSSASRGNSVSSFESLGGFVLAPNMQPQTVTGTVSSFGSLSGSHPIYSQAPLMATQAEVSGGVPLSVPTAISQDAAAQDAEMSSSSDESGSESDDEQSDSDEQSSAEEEEDKKALLKIPLKKDTAKLSTGSSVSSAPFFSGDDRFFFQGGNSGGFFGDDLISGLQGGAEEEAGNVPRDLGSEGHWLGQLQTLQPAREEKNSAFTAYTELDKDGDNTLESQQVATMPPQQEQPTTFPLVPTNSENLSGTLIPPVSSIDTPHETPALLTSLGPSSRPLSHQHSLDDSGRPGRKRKLERQSSLADNPTLRLQSLAQKTPRISSKRRRDSSLSSFSVSSVSSSDSSESSDEQSETEQPQPLASHSVLNPARSFPSSSTSSSSVPRQPPQDMVIQKALLVRNRSTSQLEAGELEDEEVEEEGEIVAEVKSLWVKIPLEKVDFQREQKPKVHILQSARVYTFIYMYVCVSGCGLLSLPPVSCLCRRRWNHTMSQLPANLHVEGVPLTLLSTRSLSLSLPFSLSLALLPPSLPLPPSLSPSLPLPLSLPPSLPPLPLSLPPSLLPSPLSLPLSPFPPPLPFPSPSLSVCNSLLNLYPSEYAQTPWSPWRPRCSQHVQQTKRERR